MFFFHFSFSVRTCETSCFTYCIGWGIVSRDSMSSTIGCVRVTDVTVTILMRSYGTGEIFYMGCLYRAYSPWIRVWVDSNGKMETRHLVDWSFCNECPAICNHCVVMTAWSRKTWKFVLAIFTFFFGETTPYGKIFKILFRKFTRRHRLTLLCPNDVNFSDWLTDCIYLLRNTHNLW